MYKLLLCWRYLKTRYIALACIISVTLGVGTMIVVNAVMAGFTYEMNERIHGILSDVVVESLSSRGFFDPQARMAEIDQVAGEYIECMTPTVSVPAMLSYEYLGQWITRPVTVVGLPENAPLAGDFAKYLQHPENRKAPSFQLREGGYDTIDQQAGPEAPPRPEMESAGGPYRRWKAARDRWQKAESRPMLPHAGRRGFGTPLPKSSSSSSAQSLKPAGNSEEGPPQAADSQPNGDEQSPAVQERAEPAAQWPIFPRTVDSPSAEIADPFGRPALPSEGRTFDPAIEQEPGCVLGIALCTYRDHEGRTRFTALPGDDVKLSLPNAAVPPRAADASFTIVDLYESKMHEYDSNFVFVPLKRLQKVRGMIDPQTGLGSVTGIQIKLKDPSQGPVVKKLLQQSKFFPQGIYLVSTWRDKQGPLLAAVQMETAILNVLLFMIIAVAGFGILAIFFMIVVEKTRDIGILKSLGASASGVLSIFLGYGLLLGGVGAGVGMIGGLLFVEYINEIADLLAWCTGQTIFDPSIYYFYKIPTQVHVATVAWIGVGAVAIAVLASIAPAFRAARLHPVEALRYE